MAGRFFKLLPEDMVREFLARNPGGGRFRFPPAESKHNPLFLADRKKAVCQAIIAGESREDTAIRHKITVRTVERYLKENNIGTRKEKAKTRKEQLQEYLGKYTKKKIAEMLGISRTRLYQIMEEEGI